MAERLVGHVEALWRYPLKSMQGERPPMVDVTPGGICGDRAYALWDHATQRVASAKNPLIWQALLGYRAHFRSPPRPGEPLPPLAIAQAEAPAAAAAAAPPLLSSDPGIDAALSHLFNRQVSLLHQAPAGASLDQYWPNVPEREFQNVVHELPLPPGTFFDACPIHALSTATLEQLRQLEPQLDFAVERFRPNLLIRPSEPAVGFVEQHWIGRDLRLGREALLRVDGGCPRCVVTTLAQGGLPQEIGILRATARHNQVVAGIRLSVLEPGAVAVGDPVVLV